MKTVGVIIVVIGVINIFMGLLAISQAPPSAGRMIGGGVTFAVIGAFLIDRAAKNKEKKQQRKEWENGDS